VRLLGIAGAVVLSALGLIATALVPTLLPHHPLVLLLLESPIRNLVLARHAPLLPFLLVAVARRLLTSWVYYLLGCWYGDAALRWWEQRSARPESVRRTERAMRTAAYPLVFFAPLAPVCLVAGSMGMSLRAFILLSAAGSAVVALVCRLVGYAFGRPLDRLLHVFALHGLRATAVVVGLLLIWLLWRRHARRRRAGPRIQLERRTEKEER
jgi:membrane protein DedA with SNARE-associated domain